MGVRSRIMVGTGIAAVLYTGSAAVVAGSAAAALPQLVGGCGDTVHGSPGQPVGIEVLGGCPITLGEVPSSGSVTFDAAGLLRPLGPRVCTLTATTVPWLTEPVHNAVGPVVGPGQGAVGPLLVLPPAGPPPAQPAPAVPSPALPAQPALQQPAPVVQPGVAPVGQVPIPAVSTGLFAARAPWFGWVSPDLLPADFFVSAPRFGILGGRGDGVDDVAAAGRATALPVGEAARIALPVLVATLTLAAVATALLRSGLARSPVY